MIRFALFSWTVLFCVLAAAPQAEAQGYPPAAVSQTARAETHDGFYLRMGLGVGYMKSSASMGDQTLKLSGTAVGLDLALGGVVAPNLIVFGEFAFLNVDNPTVTFNGTSGTSASSIDHVGIGPGIAYFIQPANIYLSGALLLGKLQIQNNNSVTAQTNWGVGANLMAGKEWWVSAEWGLGVALQLVLARNKDSGGDSSFTTVGGTVAFSATFN